MEEKNDSNNFPVPVTSPQERPVTVFPTSPSFATDRLDEGSHGGIVSYFRMVMRHKWFVIMLTVLGTIAGVLVTLPQVPVYQSVTSMEVQGFNENFLNLQNLNPNSSPDGYIDPSYEIMTQVKVLQSTSLLERVMRRMRATRTVEAQVPEDKLARIREWLHISLKPSIDRDRAIREVAGNIHVRGSESTRIIEITADSPDPKLAADFANLLIDEFIQKNLDDRWQSIQRTGEWLARQLEELKVKLEQSENAMQEYASNSGLQFTGNDVGKGGQESVDVGSIRLLQEQLLKVRTERMIAQSKYDLLASSPPEALPQVLDDPTLRDYEIRLAELKRQRAEFEPALTADHPRMQRILSQITEVQSELERARGKVIVRLRNDYDAALSHEKMLDEEFSKLLSSVSSKAATQAHYEIMKREVETNRQLYETMLSRVKETSIAAAMHVGNFRIVDAAKPTSVPFKPNLPNNAFLGTMAGMFLGVIVVLLREHADRSIQQPGDSSLYLGVPELGIIPSDRMSGILRYNGKVVAIPRGNVSVMNSKPTVELATWQRQSSFVAESFRALLTSVMFSDRRPSVLIIASPNPKEGKTTVASNLSIALTETNKRVLLVDADMRRPRLHRLFNLRNDFGLSGLLCQKTPVGSAEVVAATQETWIPGLRILSSGPSAAHLSTLLYSARLPEIIRAVRESFDAVIIDTPPMLTIADGRLLAKHADSVLMVLRAGSTTRSDGLMAIQRFVSDGSTVLGTVLVDWNPKRNGDYNYKYYSKHAEYYNESSEDESHTATGSQ